MARVILDIEDLRHNDLPPVCMKCGRPSAAIVRKHFQWCPGWTVILVLAAVLPYLIVSMILTKRATVPAPMCHQHRHHWLTRTVFLVFSLLFFIGYLVALFILSNQNDIGRPLEAWFGPLLIFGVLGILSTLGIAAVLHATSIHPREITDREVDLVRVHPDFVDAVDEELYESGIRDRRRRGRKRRGVDGMEFCPTCGELIPMGASHCRHCGDRVSQAKA